MLLLKKYWLQLVLIAIALALFGYFKYLNSTISDLDNTIVLRDSNISTLQANAKLDEIQKDALRKGITDQSDALQKQHDDAEQRANEYKAKALSIQDKYNSERMTVRDLNGSEECEVIRKIIHEGLE